MAHGPSSGTSFSGAVCSSLPLAALSYPSGRFSLMGRLLLISSRLPSLEPLGLAVDWALVVSRLWIISPRLLEEPSWEEAIIADTIVEGFSKEKP